jgi:hypothetical protein
VYWTNDGHIYAKKSESSTKQLIRNHDDILNLLRNIDFVEPISGMENGSESGEIFRDEDFVRISL